MKNHLSKTLALAGVLSVIAFFLAWPALSQQQAPPSTNQQPPESTKVVSGTTTQRAMAGELPFSCPGCDLHGVDFSGRNLTNANLSGANLARANFSKAILDGAVLTKSNLTGANLDGARLNKSDRGFASLALADLDGASIKQASLIGTDFQFASMKGTDLSGSDLTKSTTGPKPKPGGKRAANDPVTCGSANLSSLTSRIYVSNDGTDSETCGASFTAACKTISKGIARCSATGCGVLVQWAEYQVTETLQLRNGVNVYGGCLSVTATGLTSVINAPAGGKAAVSADQINSATILQGFKLIGTAATGTNGAASVTLTVSASPSLSVLNTEVIAGNGATGSTPGKSADGTAGGKASGRTGGTVSACQSTSGGQGADVENISVVDHGFTFDCNPSCPSNGCWGYQGQPGTTGTWAGGGQWGNGNCAECPSSRGDTGKTGGSGLNASCGSKGVVSGDTVGNFSGTNWTGSAGGNGWAGGNGGGGGGGGSGGYKAGVCFWVKTEDKGNSGGGGGAGGCGGANGNGGQQGGASFAVVLLNSNLTLTDSRVVGGMSGAGGNGGAAGAGGKGGDGAGGATNEGGGYGGTGGNGGAGGAGGGAAGGNGGPAIGVALVSSSNVLGQGTSYYTGSSGKPGTGGSGGTNIIAGVCVGPTGDNGNNGLIADSHQFYPAMSRR